MGNDSVVVYFYRWTMYEHDNVMLCTSGFVDDVMFSHNGANAPKSKTTSFRPVRHVAVPEAKLMFTITGLDSDCI